jgi:hypothetical protein
VPDFNIEYRTLNIEYREGNDLMQKPQRRKGCADEFALRLLCAFAVNAFQQISNIKRQISNIEVGLLY